MKYQDRILRIEINLTRIKNLGVRLFEGLMGMLSALLFIHVFGLLIDIILGLILWENPLKIFVESFYYLWNPAIESGYSIMNLIAFSLWFGLGLMISKGLPK